MKLKISLKDLYTSITANIISPSDIKVTTHTGELSTILQCVKKPECKILKLTFDNGVTRRVADTHRFMTRDNKPVFAKDADHVLLNTGEILNIIDKCFYSVDDVYDIMIPSPHWYVDQFGIINHNTGKSLGLCHLAASYVAMGHDVLYISMEMGEIQGVAKRIDANMFNMNIEHVMNLDPGTYNTRIKRVKENVTGKLVIKQYPTGAAHVGHFKALLNELKMKKNFKPRIIMVDYLGIMASTRIKGYSENTYSLVKSIAEELRGFAIENDLCIWSAAQTTRGAWGNSDIEMGDTAESAGLPATVDLLLGGLETEETIALGQQMFKQLKSRYGNKDIFTKFMIGVDKDKQKWYDVAEFTRTPRSTSEEQRAVVPSKVQPLKNKKIDVSGWDFGEQEKPKEPEKIKFDKDFSEKDIPF
jgi:hypothetical protein